MSNPNSAPKNTALEMVKHVMGVKALLGNSFDQKSGFIQDTAIPGAIKIALSGDFAKAEGTLKARGGGASSSDMTKFTDQEIKEILDACSIYYADKKQEIDDLRQGKISTKITKTTSLQTNVGLSQNQNSNKNNIKNQPVVTSNTNVTISKSQNNITNQKTNNMTTGNVGSNQGKQLNQKKQPGTGSFVKPQVFTFEDKSGKIIVYEFRGEMDARKKGNIIIRQIGNPKVSISVSKASYERELLETVESTYGDVTLKKQNQAPQAPQAQKPIELRSDTIKKQQKEFEDQIKDLEDKYKNAKGQEKKDLKIELQNLKDELELKKGYYTETLRAAEIREQIEKEKINLVAAEAKNLGPEITKIKRKIKGLETDLEKAEALSDYHDKKYTFETAAGEEKKDAEKEFTKSTQKGIELGVIAKPQKTGPLADIEKRLEEIQKKRDEADLAGDAVEMSRQNIAESRVYVERQLLEVANSKTELENAFNDSTDVNEKKEIRKIIAVLDERKKQLGVMEKLLEKQAEAFTKLHNPSNMPDETRLYQNEFAGINKTIDVESQATLAKKLEFEIINAKRSGISKEELEKITKRYENSKNFSELGRSNLQIREGLIVLASQHKNETDQIKKIQIGDILEPGTKALDALLGKEECLRRIVDIEEERQSTADADKIKALNIEEKSLRDQIAKYETIAKVYDAQERLAEAIAKGDTPEKIQALTIESQALLREAKASGLIENAREKLQPAEKTAVMEKARTMGISDKDIEKIPQFGKLSYGEQLLALDQLKQFMATKVFEDTEKIYSEKTAQKGFVGKLWRGIWKEYYMGKAEKIALAQNKNMEWKEKSEYLNLITDQVYKMDTPVNVNPDGSYNIEYLRIPKTASPEEQQLYGNFNHIAMEFTKMPYEWGQETATKAQRKMYQEAQARYVEAKEYLLVEMENKLGRKMAFAELANIDANMQMMQFNNSHPDINTIWGLMESNNNKKIAWGTAQAKFWRVSYFAAGWGTKTLFKAGIAAVIGPASVVYFAGLYGAIRAKKRAETAIKNQDKLSRKGFKNTEQQILAQLQNEKNPKKREALLEALKEYRSKGIIKKITLNEIALEETKRTQMIDASTWAKNLERLQEQIKNEQDPAKKQKLLDKLTVRIRYVNDRIENGLVNFGALKETGIENNKAVKRTRIGNQYGLMSQVAAATLLVTAYDNDIEGVMRKSFDSFMKESGNKELQERLEGIGKRGERKRDKYVLNKGLRGLLFAEGAVVAGMFMRDIYDSLHPHELTPNPIPGGGEHPNPTIPELPKDPHIYKDIGDVQFSSRGGIQTVIDMKHKLIEAYHDEIASGQTDKIPPAYLKVIQGDPTQLAKEFDWYRPDQINESVNMLKGSKIEFHNGEIDSNSIYNIHHEVNETESLINKDGAFGDDTEHGFGAEDNERYFHYQHGNTNHQDGGKIEEEDIKPLGGGRIEEEDIKPLQSHGLNHIDGERQNPDDLLKEQKINKPAGTNTGNKAPKIKSPGPTGPSQPQILNPRYPNGGYPLNPGVRTYNVWNLFGNNFTPSEKTLDTLGQLDAHEVLKDPSQYGSTGNMGEAIAYVKKAGEELGIDPYKSSVYTNENIKDYLERLAEAKLEQTA